jgi:MFS family permease
MISPAAARAAGYGLDGLNLFVANIQTGFGPFIAVYLTTHGWTQTSIGIALSVGTIAAVASQVPAGALVDIARRKSSIAGFSLLAFTASALLFAIQPIPLLVYFAEVLHGFSSCTLGPSIAAMSLALMGRMALGPRLGRNACFASIGNGVGAALMGACGYYLSSRSVFFLTAALTLPALAALLPLRALDELALQQVQASAGKRRNKKDVMRVLADRRLLTFAVCAMLFTFSNAPMLPLASAAITKTAPDSAILLVAAFIVLPQLVVALLSPRIGVLTQTRGRRQILLLGLCVLPLRGLLLAVVPNPFLLMPVQLLDGISAACFGVLVPLVTSDLAAGTGHYNLSLGLVGFAVGIGATLSTTLAGLTADHLGSPTALLCLAAVGFAATLFAYQAMPETIPQGDACSAEGSAMALPLRRKP